MKALLACLVFAASAIGQDMALSQYPPTLRVSFTNPSGVACSPGQAVLYAAAVTTMWTCQNGVYVQTSGAGGASIAPFTTDGTNVTLPTGRFRWGIRCSSPHPFSMVALIVGLPYRRSLTPTSAAT